MNGKTIPYETFVWDMIGTKLCGKEFLLSENEMKKEIDQFIDLFENENYIAYGYSNLSKEHMKIPVKFWKYFRTYASVPDFCHEFESDQYGFLGPLFEDRDFGVRYTSVIVEKGLEMTQNKKSGRPPKAYWMTVAAKACQIVHDDGYPESQAELIRKLQDSLDSSLEDAGYGLETLKNLVSKIYNFRT